MFPSLSAFGYKGCKLFPNFFRDIFSSIPPDTEMHWVAPKWNWRLQTTVVAWLQSGSLPSRFLMFPSLAAFDYKGYKLFPNFFWRHFSSIPSTRKRTEQRQSHPTWKPLLTACFPPSKWPSLWWKKVWQVFIVFVVQAKEVRCFHTFWWQQTWLPASNKFRS